MGCTESKDTEPKGSGWKKLTTKRKRKMKDSTNQVLGGHQDYDFHGVVDGETSKETPRKKRKGGGGGKHSVTGGRRIKVGSRCTSNTLSQTSGDGDQEGAPRGSIVGATTAVLSAAGSTGEHPNPLALPQGLAHLWEQSLGSDDGGGGGNIVIDSHIGKPPKSKSPFMDACPMDSSNEISSRYLSAGSSSAIKKSSSMQWSFNSSDEAKEDKMRRFSPFGFGVLSARSPNVDPPRVTPNCSGHQLGVGSSVISSSIAPSVASSDKMRRNAIIA